jgi:hypothetical protein
VTSNKEQLKEYLKTELRAANVFPTDDEAQFDKVTEAFATAIDKYLKQNVKVEIGIHSTTDLITGTGITIEQGVLV